MIDSVIDIDFAKDPAEWGGMSTFCLACNCIVRGGYKDHMASHRHNSAVLWAQTPNAAAFWTVIVPEKVKALALRDCGLQP